MTRSRATRSLALAGSLLLSVVALPAAAEADVAPPPVERVWIEAALQSEDGSGYGLSLDWEGPGFSERYLVRGQEGPVAPGVNDGAVYGQPELEDLDVVGLKPATQYSFTVWGSDPTGTVLGPPASLTVNGLQVKELRLGKAVKENRPRRISGVVVDSVTGQPVAGLEYRVSQLERGRFDDTGFEARTDARGRFTTAVSAEPGTQAVIWSRYGTTHLPVRAVTPRIRAYPSVTGGFRRVFVARGGAQPYRIEAPAAMRGATATVQTRRSGKWRVVARTKLDRRGQAVVRARAHSKGSNCFRTKLGAKSYYLASTTEALCFLVR